MTEKNIESQLNEQRVFPPSPEFSKRANIQRRDFPQFIRNPLSGLFMGTPFRKPFFILFQASLLHFWFPPIRGGTISIACFANHARLPKGHDNTGTMRNQVDSPTPASILQPFLYRFLRDHAVFASRGNETFEAVQSAEVNRVSLDA